MRARIIFLLAVGLSLVSPSLFGAGTQSSANQVLAVIVSPEQLSQLPNKSELGLIYWRKKLYWANHQRIRPINLSTEHALRQAFSMRVLKSLPESQTDYWNGMYYHGVSPPYVVNSAEAMLRTVAETAGAIGYIAACEADKRVKVLAWIDAEGQFLLDQPTLDCAEK